ncbi:MAG: prolyl oligopeptidase family serine peptidase [Bacteroidales bacterium]|nr:prolyl oligopeptidase family serine peptidase [Bacteroidales bacterium]
MISTYFFKKHLITSFTLLLGLALFSCQTEQEREKAVSPINPEGAPFSPADQQIIEEVKILNKRLPSGSYDPVESKIIQGTFEYPKSEGQPLMTSEGKLLWETIETDSAGWFQHKTFRNNYAYVSVHSDRDKIVLLEGMGHRMVFVNGEPRTGNLYQLDDNSPSWRPQYNYSLMPIKLKEGKNHLLFRCTRGKLKIRLNPMRSAVMLNVNDPTFPDLIKGEPVNDQAAVIVVNGTGQPRGNLSIRSESENLQSTTTSLPVVAPMTIRKVPFDVKGQAPTESGHKNISLSLKSGERIIDTSTVRFSIKNPNEPQRKTFISEIDGSLQYYAINPASSEENESKALFLSVHGASVEAINQAQSYHSKPWGHVVAPTNRRPYGYDWENWGRIDAIEVLDIAKEKYNIDPERVYLTGHSMGGHGTWYLGVTYPDKWAAIGPSAGWNSFWTYGGSRLMEEANPTEKLYYRSMSPSNTFGLVENLRNNTGVYIIHGKDDQVVSVDQAYQMMDTLDKYEINYRFHEEPGAGHWWDNSDAPGAACVDWPPLFDYFARHRMPENEEIRQVTFVTANPGVSAYKHWLGIEAQINHLEISKADIEFVPGKNVFQGNTENVARLGLKLDHLTSKDSISFAIDGHSVQKVPYPEQEKQLWLSRSGDGSWETIDKPSKKLKGPHRYGTFKGAFKNHFMFVYATQGNPGENQHAYDKARYDAETFWYQGNGAVDIIPDTAFNASDYAGRDVILYGNAKTNAAWDDLLTGSPIQVNGESISVGDKNLNGNNLACVFVRPRDVNGATSVGVVSATGPKGWRLLNSRKYMYPFYNAPDFAVYDASEIGIKNSGIQAAGYFGIDWSLKNGEVRWNNDRE